MNRQNIHRRHGLIVNSIFNFWFWNWKLKIDLKFNFQFLILFLKIENRIKIQFFEQKMAKSLNEHLVHGRASFIITTYHQTKIVFVIDKTEESNTVCIKVMEAKKITWFCYLYKHCEAANFISDESSFQGLSNYILFFSFYKVVEELLKKENRNLLVKLLKTNKHTLIASWLVF